jgi:hypothetical protein
MKKLTVLMAVLALVALMGSFAQAQQACYQLHPFVDVIRLAHIDNSTHRSVFGNWTSPFYTLPVTGARELNLNGLPYRLGLHGTNNSSSSFGGNMICALDGIKNQPWTVTCVGTATPFVNSGDSLRPVSCTAAPQQEGPVAGK